MSKTYNKPTPSGADVQPSSLNELAVVVQEFFEKYDRIRKEEELLKLDRKELLEEYADKLDMSTLKLAMRAVELRDKVKNADTFDNFVEILERKGG